MPKAGVFDDFKGATTLLLWGDAEGIAALHSGLKALQVGKVAEFAIEDPADDLRIMRGQDSTLVNDSGGLRWRCSLATIKLAADLAESLLNQPGHQFLDVNGLAEQAIISRDEYPADLR